MCQAGRTLIGRCPHGLVFNGNTKRCDYLEACASQTTPGYESTTTSSPVTVPYSTTSAPQTSGVFCENRPLVKVSFLQNSTSITTKFSECVRDGVFSEGCSTEFLVCSNGIGHHQKCPDGLVFNVELGLCDYEYNCGQVPQVPQVPQMPGVTPTTAQPVYSTSAPYVPPTDNSRVRTSINDTIRTNVFCYLYKQ